MKVFGVTGWKNTGKTGLMERLVAEITARGFSVSTLKHAHHVFDVDQEGKDSHRHRVAGAKEVLVSSRIRWAHMAELRGAEEPSLAQHLSRMSQVDLVLVEGWKGEDHAKIECHRAQANKPLIALSDGSIKLVASDSDIEAPVGVVDLNDTSTLADFILEHVGLITRTSTEPLKPPPLRDDCFALPPGVNWLPVDDALDRLQQTLACVVGSETLSTNRALGRILAEDVIANRSNPPGANAAVDGYGFANKAITDGAQFLPLVTGRAAAGQPFTENVPEGHAVRILTGALLPQGVDTVVLEEDTTTDGSTVSFRGPIKFGSNTRKAGEDVETGHTILGKGRRITPADLALLTATGVGSVRVRAPLRVGVISTGDELGEVSEVQAPADVTYDANRPMLLAMIAKLGFEAVDLGHVADDRVALKKALDDGASRVDAILTSGGASAGDEDHVSALLKENGRLTAWRIAVKPGRPLALATWNGVPVFGLPGNPVAAFVCTAIFARPALTVMAGGNWPERTGVMVPASFAKNKKAGRREYLRARLDKAGHVEVFASEGSGRISGLSWATGLVELSDEAQTISPGDLVRYLPFSALGIE